MTTKDKILQVVVEYIKDNTYADHISLSQIAEKAQIGKSTVYEYFSSKEALITETYLYLLEQYQEVLIQDIKGRSFKEAYYHLIQSILYVIKDARLFMIAVMNHQKDFFMDVKEPLENKICELKQKMETKFDQVLQLGYQEKIIHPSYNPYVRNILNAFIIGLLFQYVNEEITITEDKLLDLIFAQSILLINQ